MDLLQLMRKARTVLEPHWFLAIGVCLVYGLAVALPAELNGFGEMVSFLLAGPLQLGLGFFFLNLVLSQNFLDLQIFHSCLLYILLLLSLLPNSKYHTRILYSLDSLTFLNLVLGVYTIFFFADIVDF